MEDMAQEFAKALSDNPELLAKLRRGRELDHFKKTYNVERATPFKCPVCSRLSLTGGSLWINKDDKSLFTCRRCHLTFRIECQTLSNEEVIWHMRQIQKGEEESVHWYDRQQGET